MIITSIGRRTIEMKSRFLSVIITICLIVSSMAMPAFAANAFPDVLSPDHDWAKDQIAEMTNIGIIKGYTDGTFKPDKSISKIEALLLFARVAGYSYDGYDAFKEYATQKYQYMLNEIELGSYNSLKQELAFLLYKGMMTDEELTEYLDADRYSEEFPRQDAAKLITKLMDGEVKNVSPDSLDFADASAISSEAAGYISYVVENGLMNGVQKDDNTVVFDAQSPLSRAQVSVLLYRIMDKLDMSVEAGVVEAVNVEGGTIDFTGTDGVENSYIVPDDSKIIVDGVKSSIEKIMTNSDIAVVRYGKIISAIEIISPESNLTVKGTVNSFVSKDNFIKLSVNVEESEEVATYYANQAFKVTTDGVMDSVDSIKLNDYVVIKLLGTNIISVDRLTSQATVQGTVEKLSFTSPITLSVLTVDEITKDENVSEYTVSEKATIRKNGEKISLREVMIGDAVVITIERGNITKIVATSSKGSVTGTVTAMKIAAQSSITVSVNGTETEYPVSMSAEFIVGNEVATIYDLRLGNVVKLTLSGSTATKIEQTSASSVTTKSGAVENVSTSYGYISILSTDITGTFTEQIFVSKTGSAVTAKILNGETGKEINLKDIKEDDYIIATGAYTNGAFIAKTIVVTPKAK